MSFIKDWVNVCKFCIGGDRLKAERVSCEQASIKTNGTPIQSHQN